MRNSVLIVCSGRRVSVPKVFLATGASAGESATPRPDPEDIDRPLAATSLHCKRRAHPDSGRPRCGD